MSSNEAEAAVGLIETRQGAKLIAVALKLTPVMALEMTLAALLNFVGSPIDFPLNSTL